MKIKATTLARKNYTILATDSFMRKGAKEFYSRVRCLNHATAASFTPSPAF
jgi:hypothetical protein